MASPATDPASLLFARFRERGDPDALTQLFDLAAPELMALARHLAPSGLAAEDLVQECFLTAIHKARRWNPKRPILPWLTGILIRDARSQRRRIARSLDFDRLQRGSTPSGERAALDAELHRSVELALADLPPLYREVVAASLLDGEDSSTIAKRLSRAPGTVRVQLHRGIDMLRKALPPGIGLGALSHWMPRGMGEVRRIIQLEAIHHGPALVATGGAVSLALPSTALLTMSVKTYASAALAIVAIGWGVAHWSSLDAGKPLAMDAIAPTLQLEAQTLEAAPKPSSVALRTQVAEEAKEANPKAEAPAPVAPSTNLGPLLQGTLMAEVPLEPTVFELEVNRGQAGKVTVDLEGPGPFEVDLQPLFQGNEGSGARVLVVVRAQGYQPYSAVAKLQETESSGPQVYTARLHPKAIKRILRGQVVHPEGLPMERPWVGFLPDALSEHEDLRSYSSSRLDDDGKFELEMTDADPGTLLFTASDFAVGEQRVSAQATVEVDLGKLVLEAGATIQGRATMNGQAMAESSRVVAILPYEPTPRSLVNRSLVLTGKKSASVQRAGHRTTEASVDRHGDFVLTGLSPGATYRLLALPITRDKGLDKVYRSEESGQLVQAPATGITCDWGLMELTLRVRCQGKPVGDARVYKSFPPDDRQARNPIPIAGGWVIPQRGYANGKIDLYLAKGDPAYLKVEAPGYSTNFLILDDTTLTHGQVLDVELIKTGEAANLRVNLECADPDSLDGALAFLYLFNNGSELDQAGPVTVRAGTALFEKIPLTKEKGTLHIYLPQTMAFADLPLVETGSHFLTWDPLQPGEEQTRTVKLAQVGRLELHLTGRDPLVEPSFELVPESGDPWSPSLIVPAERGHDGSPSIASDGPIYLDQSIPPGRYELRQVGPGYTPTSVTVEVKPGETSLITFGLQLK